MVSARLSVIALGVTALLALPAEASAFGLRLGPFYLGLPGPVHRHGGAGNAKAPESVEPGGRTAKADNPTQTNERASSDSAINDLAQTDRPTLLYPDLVLLDREIFSPRAEGRWPFNYQNIIHQAFAKYPAKPAAEYCRYRDTSGELAAQIGRDITPRDDQKPLVQNLGTALGQAKGYLIKSCPSDVPLVPVDRLKLMDQKIDALIMALEIIRPPLQQLEQSLDERQRALWDETQAATDNRLAACASVDRETGSWPLSQLEQAIQPTSDQRDALPAVKDAFDRAANELAGECSGGIPHPASARLEYIVGRLDATWQAVQTIEVALGSLEKDLSDEQKARLDTLEIVSAR